ncbi:MAG: hypothetical protein EHM39_08605 [Chloroflexi bacterium]|nr:MAG: hypothetical protein EHM39_08605 [Chloroflexota bacterium]
MNKIIVLLAATTIALGALCAIQLKRNAQVQRQLTALTAQLESKNAEAEDLIAARQHAEQQRAELLQTADQLAAQLRQPQVAEVAAPVTNAPEVAASTNSQPSGLGDVIGKMMSDPDTKKFIRDQQRAMMDQLYKPLIKQLGLTPEQAAGFKDLLADNMMKGAEKAGSLFGGASQTNRAELTAAMAADQKAFDDQVKDFLGEDRYSSFKDYQETVGDRAQLNMYRQQNDAGEYPLNDLQIEQLLAAVKEEKRNVSATMGATFFGADQQQAAMDAMLSEENADKLIQSQEIVNERVFQRARSILSPDQLQAYAGFQTNQLQMMRVGMTMIRKMMGPSQSTTAVQPNP